MMLYRCPEAERISTKTDCYILFPVLTYSYYNMIGVIRLDANEVGRNNPEIVIVD